MTAAPRNVQHRGSLNETFKAARFRVAGVDTIKNPTAMGDNSR